MKKARSARRVRDAAMGALALLALAGGGCGSSVGAMGDETPLTGRSRNLVPAPFEPVWRLPLGDEGLSRDEGEALAAPAHDPAGNRLWVGNAEGMRCLRASDGHLLWKTDVPGGISGSAVFDDGRVLVGTDGGELIAFGATTGAIVWRYRVQGAIVRRPIIAGDLVYFVDGTNAVFALERKTGVWKWQYRREAPAEFALFGESAPRVVDGRVHIGFSDGFIVTLGALDGVVLWSHDLAPQHDRFQDVDATPAVIDDAVFAASAASGLYKLDAASGKVRWMRPIRGIIGLAAIEGDLYASLDVGTILRLSASDGRPKWRTAFGEAAGSPGQVQPFGQLLLVSLARRGLHALDRRTGRPVWHFAPSTGLLAPPTVSDDGSVFLVTNGSVLYGLRPGRHAPVLDPLNPLASGTGRGVF